MFTTGSIQTHLWRKYGTRNICARNLPHNAHNQKNLEDWHDENAPNVGLFYNTLGYLLHILFISSIVSHDLAGYNLVASLEGVQYFLANFSTSRYLN
jgi:hypothetical protein